MLTAQRKQIIQSELDRAGRVIARDLAQRFDLSEDTIRRDLRQMASAGLCQRVYGGAVAPSAGKLAVRHDHLSAEKTRLAQTAVTLLQPGQTVMIDAGSTNTAIARALPTDMNLTIATNAPDIAHLLIGRSDLRLIMLGGNYHPGLGACLGRETRAAITNLQAHWLFLGTCGLDADAGVTAFDAGEAEVKATMAAFSDQVAIAVTGEKLGTAAHFPVLPTEKVHSLIAEDRSALTPYRKKGLSVVTPG